MRADDLGYGARIARAAGLLAVAGALGCGGPLDAGPDGSSADAAPDEVLDAWAGDAGDGAVAFTARWGRLASPGLENERVASALFFAGSARDGSNAYGEQSVPENLSLYTERPQDVRHLEWSESVAMRDFALDAMEEVGINTVAFSYWGPRGTDWWARYAPMQSSTYAHDELFDAAEGRSLVLVPFIESHTDWTFRGEFPGAPDDPAPVLRAQLRDLIERYLLSPESESWPSRWALMWDRDGRPRRAVMIIHAASDDPACDDARFAAGLDRVADTVEAETGVRVGFLLDALPPQTNAPGAFHLSPWRSGPALRGARSFLGIACFLSEIWPGFAPDAGEDARIAWKDEFARAWSESGVPFLLDLTPGYDASIVFPGSVTYGHSATWRGAQADMVREHAHDGVLFGAWNGYTESTSLVPTIERGSVALDWARSIVRELASR